MNERDSISSREVLLEKKRVYARAYRAKNYEKLRASEKKRYYDNLVKRQELSRRCYHKNKEKSYLRNVKRYGMSVNEYQSLLKEQKEVCAICKNPCTSGKRLAIDHCHSTGLIRGLLCTNCNTGLGKFKDSSLLLGEAIKYIEKGNS